MIKLTELLNKIIEGKQVGDLYHFTPLSNLMQIIKTRNLIPNAENHISTSRRPNMVTSEFEDMHDVPIARLMLDGNKISNKYKVQPFSFGGDEGNGEDLGEEQIIVSGNNFPFLSYLKRIDIFLNKKRSVNSKILDMLKKGNIPYNVYQGTPISNIPYTQSKVGTPEDIDIDNIPSNKMYTNIEMYFIGMKIETIELYTDKYMAESNITKTLHVGVSSEYPDYYLLPEFSQNKKYHTFLNLKKEPIAIKYIPMKLYDDPEWRKMWKTNVYPPDNHFSVESTYNCYILIPKNFN